MLYTHHIFLSSLYYNWTQYLVLGDLNDFQIWSTAPTAYRPNRFLLAQKLPRLSHTSTHWSSCSPPPPPFLLFGWLGRSPWRRNGGVVFLDMSLYIFLPNLRHNSISFVLSSHLSCQYGVPEDAWHPDESTVLMILVHLTPFRYPGSRAIAYRFRLLRWDSINHIGK